MKVLFSPVLSETRKIEYTFTENSITIQYKGETDTFDFSNFGDGELVVIGEDGEDALDTTLDILPIESAKKEDGVLYVELLNFIGLDATDEECFPNWIDHTEYIPPKVGEVNGQDEMEE